MFNLIQVPLGLHVHEVTYNCLATDERDRKSVLGEQALSQVGQMILRELLGIQKTKKKTFNFTVIQ